MKKKLLIAAACLLALVCLVVGILHSCTGGQTDGNMCMVTFETNGGSAIADVELEAGTTIPENEIGTPTKDGYVLAGWYSTEDLSGKPWDFGEDKVYKDMTLFAKWTTANYILTIDTPAHASYSITAQRGSEQLSSGSSITVEDVIILTLTAKDELPGRLVVRGEKNLFDFVDGVLSNVAENVTVSYTELADGEYWITYAGVRGVTHTNPEIYTADQEVILTAPSEKEGYQFAGWYIGDEKVEDLNGRTGDLTVTAKWEPITYQITYLNIENAYNGNPETYSIETTEVLTAAEKDGYEFLGWYLDGKKILSLKGRTGDLTLTAQWGPERVKSIFATQYMTQIANGFQTDEQHGWKFARTKKDYTYTKFEIQTTITPTADNAALGFYIGRENDGFIMEFTGWTDSVMYIYVNGNWESQAEANGMALYPITGKKLPKLQKDVPITVKMQYDTGMVKIYWLVDGQWELVLFGDAIAAANNNTRNVTFDRYEPVRTGVAAWETATDAGIFTDIKISSWSGSIKKYNVTYLGVEGAEHGNPDYYITGDDNIPLAMAGKENYQFLGWYIGTQRVTTLSGMSGDVTLTAKWAETELYTHGPINGTTSWSEVTVHTDGTVSASANALPGTANADRWLLSKDSGAYVIADATWVFNAATSRFGGGFYLSDGSANVLMMFHTGSGSRTVEIYKNTNQWKRDISIRDTSMLVNGAFTTMDVRLIYSNGTAQLLIKTQDGGYTAWTEPFSLSDLLDSSKPVHAGAAFWSGEWAGGTIQDLNIDFLSDSSEFAITYNLNGGSNPADAPVSYVLSDAQSVALPTPTKAGYTFLGWYCGGSKIISLEGCVGDLMLTAKWLSPDFAYTYGNLSGTTGISDIDENADGSVSISANLSNAASNAERWILSKESGTYAVADATFVYTGERFGGGFYLSDGTTRTLLMFHAGGGSKLIEMYLGTSNWKLDIPVEELGILDNSGRFTSFDVRMVYNSGNIQLLVKNTSGGYDAWTDVFRISEKLPAFDSTKPVQVGAAFWSAWNAGGTIKNFTVSFEMSNTPYSIRYELNGGTNASDAPASYSVATALDIVLPTPTKDGYDFMGWYIGDTKITTLVGREENITLTAKWKESTWYTYGDVSGTGLYDLIDNEDGSVTVSANQNMGTVNMGRWLLSKQTGTYATATATWNHTQSSRFGGGYYLSDGTTNVLIMFHTGTGSRKIEIYNSTNTWKTSLSVDTGMLTDGIFDSIDTKMVYDNGLVLLYYKQPDAAEYTQWVTVTVSDYVPTFDASKAVHVGLGFWSGEWASGQIADFSIDWTVHETEYTVTYELGGGTVVGEAPESYTELTAADVVLPAATLDGYDFLGWYNGDTPVESLAGMTGNITLTAKWEKITWYTTGQLDTTSGLTAVTEHDDGSVSITVNANGNNANTEGWLLSKESGTYAVADASFVYANAAQFGGGFYICDGTTDLLVCLRYYRGWKVYIYQDLTSSKASVSVTDTSVFTGNSFTALDMRMIYDSGTIQLLYKNAEESYTALIDPIVLSDKVSAFDSTQAVQVGVGFIASASAGGHIQNFSIDWTAPVVTRSLAVTNVLTLKNSLLRKIRLFLQGV